MCALHGVHCTCLFRSKNVQHACIISSRRGSANSHALNHSNCQHSTKNRSQPNTASLNRSTTATMAAQQPSAIQTSPDRVKELMQSEIKLVKEGVPGHSEKRFAWNKIATTEMDDLMNEAISFLYHNTLMLDAQSAYFNRDNVALPNFALFSKICATDSRNLAFRYIDFQNKRGAAVKIGAVGAPMVEFHSDEGSDVLMAVRAMLAAAKVSYTAANQAWSVAVKNGDAHAAHFLSNIAYGWSLNIEELCSHVTHLTLVEDNKLAIKEWDRALGRSLAPLAMAVGTESTLPSRLVMGGNLRRLAVTQAKIDKSVVSSDMDTEVGMKAFTNIIA